MTKSTTEFMTPNEVAEFLGYSYSYACKLIVKLNNELREQGYLTFKGKVQRSYFMSKFFKAAA